MVIRYNMKERQGITFIQKKGEFTNEFNFISDSIDSTDCDRAAHRTAVRRIRESAAIISGVKKKSKVVIGKASIRIPFFERLDKLNLRLIPIDVKTSNAVPTADYININVDATVNIKISNDPEKLRLAAENFLNKNTEYIAGVAREVLEGNVREIVGKMKLEEMVSDRQKFANLVKENAEPDLAAMGLDIISFNVQNFVDGQ